MDSSLHSLASLQAAAAEAVQSSPTLCDPIDSSPPGSPVPGILQARTLEWVADESLCFNTIRPHPFLINSSRWTLHEVFKAIFTLWANRIVSYVIDEVL